MTPGIYNDITESAYHDDCTDVPSLSASIAKILIANTPLHAWAAHLNPNFVREEKEIFDRGTVAHALLLQGIEAGVVLDHPDWKKRAARDDRDAIRAQGKIPILSKNWDVCVRMVERAREQLAAHREAKDAFTNGKPEVTIVWEDEASDGTKVMCRGRIDWLDDDYKRIFDYKSTGREVNPDVLASKMINDGWDIQSTFYRRGIQKLTGVDPTFLFVAQENTDPYALSVIGIGPDFQWLGEKKCQAAIDLWAKCITTNDWPGYPTQTCFPILPEWEEKRWLAREMESL